MGRPRILDRRLMDKLADKVGKTNVRGDISRMVSREAAKLSVFPEVALILLAKKHGIGTAAFYRKLDATKQAQVRDALPSPFATARGRTSKSTAKGSRQATTKLNPRSALKHELDYLIQDEVLRARCKDILLGTRGFDRAINQATQVLEDRIRKKATPTARLTGDNLVGYAFNEECSKTRLRLASNDADDQRGFTQILRGIVPAFRNKTHHHIIEVSRGEAMCVCGFIDVLLRIVDSSTKVRT